MKVTKSLGTLQYAIIVLTVLTAVMHLALAARSSEDTLFFVLFILNGIGYLALIVGLYFIPALAPQRSLVRWALIGFAGVTIIAYFAFNGSDSIGSGLVNKAIEVALIVLLLRDKS